MSDGRTIGAAIGLVVAAAASYFTAGTSLAAYAATFSAAAVTAGAAIGGALDSKKAAPLIGPRLGDLAVQTSTYGAFIPRGYGVISFFGNLFWLQDGHITEVATKSSAGGKGGMMGGGGADTTSFSYFAHLHWAYARDQ